MSLNKEISKLTNPTPDIFDPEDEYIDTDLEKYKELNNSVDFSASQLRSRNAPLLEDIDPSYAGKKVSRKSLGLEFQKEKKVTFKASNSAESGESELDDSDGYSEDDFSEADINEFKNLILADSRSSDNEKQSSSEADDDEEEQKSIDEASTESENEENTHDVNNVLQKLSNIDMAGEFEKGQAVKNQKEIWNKLLESRIKLQKVLIVANKMPQNTCFQSIKEEGGQEFMEALKKGSEALRTVLDTCLEIHTQLIRCNSDFQSVDKGDKSQLQSDEVISSEDESINEEVDEQVKKKTKRKYKWDEYSAELAKRFKDDTPYRNTVIQKWDEKTRLSTGRMTQKSFNAFSNSALKQIEQVLQDKNRLIKRTQLKRTLYSVIGKEEIEEPTNEEESISTSKQDILLKHYDPEIFDDDDFYRQILKNVIESKSFGMDPILLRKHMEIQKVRNKMKRKIDTKASKGRKLRFDVHSKLINFMAPVQIATIPDDSRDNILKCLFGKKHSIIA